MNKSTTEIIEAKDEDRGWHQGYEIGSNKNNPITVDKLPLSLDEYKAVSLLISKLAINDQSETLTSLYFDLQRRAMYGNGYPQLEGMDEIEKLMWNIGVELPNPSGGPKTP